MPHPASILHLEESPHDARLVLDQLSRGPVPCSVRAVHNRSSYQSALTEGRFDLILADYHFADYDGLAALVAAREADPEVPFILVTGVLGEEPAVNCLRQGATDYVPKTHLERLVPAVERALTEARDRRQRQDTEELLRMMRFCVDRAGDSVFWISREGRILYVNDSACATSQYSREELLLLNKKGL